MTLDAADFQLAKLIPPEERPTTEPVWVISNADRFIELGVLDHVGWASGAFGPMTPAVWSALAETAMTKAAKWRPLQGARFAPPLCKTSRIFCIGKNYTKHAAEMGMAAPMEAPDVFLRLPSSFSGHDGVMPLPAGEDSFDYEAELALVIGRGGRHISEADAAEHVFGITAANDGSLRRTQKRTSQFTLGKNGDNSGLLGPCIQPLSPGELAMPRRVKSMVDGQQRQNGSTADMIFSPHRLIAILSTTLALQPGDIILTGTPDGVGAGLSPPGFLQDGQMLTVEVEGVPPLTGRVERSGHAVF